MLRVISDDGKVYLFNDAELESAFKRNKNREKWSRYVKCADPNCGKEFQRISRMKRTDGLIAGVVPRYCSEGCRNRYNGRMAMRKLRYQKEFPI